MQIGRSEQLVQDTAILTPSITTNALTIFGVPVPELILYCTLAYTVLAVGHKVYTIAQDIRKKRKKHD